ncbi:Secreted protein [Erysiphe neolycopersici]|uniref:Secreted protein n=1 Tax=Erysiphe neolycopersici TaxID=212602 RepID=A0A420H7S2_9PEZI|nr:Secreted protein [Erysiphe neolycopersici]
MKSMLLRTDLIKGPYTRDTSYILTPYNSNFKLIKNVPYKAALEISQRGFRDISIINEQPITRAPTREKTQIRSRSLSSKSTNRDIQVLDNQKFFTASKQPSLVIGYTTVDDGGSDGDDTLHLPMTDIVWPPPILSAVVGLPAEGEPEYVDLVFDRSITSMMLILLNNKGHNFNTANVEDYSIEPIRDIISQWIKDNWAGEC